MMLLLLLLLLLLFLLLLGRRKLLLLLLLFQLKLLRRAEVEIVYDVRYVSHWIGCGWLLLNRKFICL
jgi:hypothetical protein